MAILFGSSLIQIVTDWDSFKATVVAGNLEVKYHIDGNYILFCIDGPVVYICYIYMDKVPDSPSFDQAKNDRDKVEFESNYKDSANIALVKKDGSGIQLFASSSPVDPLLIDTREGLYKLIDKDNLTAEWTVPYSFVQLQGIKFDIKGTEAGDSIALVEIGFSHPLLGWIQYGWYGKNIYFTGGDYIVEDSSQSKSYPIPRGLTLRLTYAQADPESNTVKKMTLLFKFWRPYDG